MILADWMEEREPRGSHGIPMSEATDPALAAEWEATSRRDYAARAINRTKDAYEKQYAHDELDWS